jgi:hypothetical protein
MRAVEKSDLETVSELVPATVNETPCKILRHNLVVLIHEMCELGIDPLFWPSITAV